MDFIRIQAITIPRLSIRTLRSPVLTTDNDGRYRFKTIKPAAKPCGPNRSDQHTFTSRFLVGRQTCDSDGIFEGGPLPRTISPFFNRIGAQGICLSPSYCSQLGKELGVDWWYLTSSEFRLGSRTLSARPNVVLALRPNSTIMRVLSAGTASPFDTLPFLHHPHKGAFSLCDVSYNHRYGVAHCRGNAVYQLVITVSVGPGHAMERK